MSRPGPHHFQPLPSNAPPPSPTHSQPLPAHYLSPTLHPHIAHHPHFAHHPATSPLPNPSAPYFASPAPARPAKKPRKPYVITKNRENWTPQEHQSFLDALKKHGRNWKQIELQVKTKNVIQIRSHAQKYFLKVQKNNTGEHVPPPRPKRKSSTSVASAQRSAQMSAPQSAPQSPALYSPHPALVASPNMSNYAMHMAAAAAFPYPYPGMNPHAMAAAMAATSPVLTQPSLRRAKSLPTGSVVPTDEIRGIKRGPATPNLSVSAAMARSPKVMKKENAGAVTPRTELAGKLQGCKVGGKEPIATTSPNFAGIYAFFAKMFDPAMKFDAMKGVKEDGMSALDKEVIKLLMSNLEFNIANTTFRQQLLETYRQQLQQSVQQTVA